MNIIGHVETWQLRTELVSKPGAKKSPVWEYFGFEADDKGKPVKEDRPICKKCSRTVATKSGNTYVQSSLASSKCSPRGLQKNEGR